MVRLTSGELREILDNGNRTIVVETKDGRSDVFDTTLTDTEIVLRPATQEEVIAAAPGLAR